MASDLISLNEPKEDRILHTLPWVSRETKEAAREWLAIKMMNQGPEQMQFDTVKSMDLKCNTQVCQGECCRFVTEFSRRADPDLKKYMKLHGVLVKDAPGGGAWLRYPVKCEAFDEKSMSCTAHGERPEICRAYPRRESPFISAEKCSLIKGVN